MADQLFQRKPWDPEQLRPDPDSDSEGLFVPRFSSLHLAETEGSQGQLTPSMTG